MRFRVEQEIIYFAGNTDAAPWVAHFREIGAYCLYFDLAGRPLADIAAQLAPIAQALSQLPRLTTLTPLLVGPIKESDWAAAKDVTAGGSAIDCTRKTFEEYTLRCREIAEQMRGSR